MNEEKGQRERYEVAIGGMGGQGVLFASRLLVEGGEHIYPHITSLVNYAGVMRGGQNDATVILSKKRIASQILGSILTAVLLHPTPVFMGQSSLFQKYVKMVRRGGKLFLNSSLVKDKITRDDIQIYQIPVLDIVGKEQGMLTNMVMLGAYVENEKIFPLENIERALDARMPGMARQDLLNANKEALQKGAEFVSGHRP